MSRKGLLWSGTDKKLALDWANLFNGVVKKVKGTKSKSRTVFEFERHPHYIVVAKKGKKLLS